MTEMFGEAWSPMSVPDLAQDDDDDSHDNVEKKSGYLSRHEEGEPVVDTRVKKRFRVLCIFFIFAILFNQNIRRISAHLTNKIFEQIGVLV